MNLGIFLSPGDSLNNMKKSGQADRFVELYLKLYAQHFTNIYLFSYEDERDWVLPKNVFLVSNKTGYHRLTYAFLLPLIQFKAINDCDVIRGFGLASSISSFMLFKPFVFNWAYDYITTVKIQHKYLYIPFYWMLERLAFYRANKVFIATKTKLNNLNNKKMIYLPNGVDLKLFKTKNHLLNKILFVGRFEKEKNLQFLIKSVGLLDKTNRRITLVGSGSYDSAINNWAKQNGVNIKIIKPMANTKLASFMNNFSVFVLTSYSEGIPKVLIEAMAIGLVPVVTNFPTAKDIITDKKDGFITDFKEQAFAQKLDLALTNRKIYNQLSKNAKQKIMKEFNLDLILKKEIGILKNV